MSKINVYGSFMQTFFFSGAVAVPKYFLTHYAELGISHEEAMLIIHILGELEKANPMGPEALAQHMKLDLAQIERMLAKLTKQNFLAIEKKWNPQENTWTINYNLVGLIDELAELWAIEQVKEFEKEQNQAALRQSPKAYDPVLEKLIRTFEQELGRPLTEIECNIINGWISAHFSEDLIMEALKRGVSAGIRNFRYLDSILREWEKKGLRTRAEVEADDAYFQSRQETKQKSKARTSRKVQPDKYENFYL